MKNIVHVISTNIELIKNLKFFSRQMEIQLFTYPSLTKIQISKLNYMNEIIIIDDENITRVKEIKTINNIITFCILKNYNQKMIIQAFEEGIDDYFIIPFSYVELLLKVNIVLRYRQNTDQRKYVHNTLIVDDTYKKVYIDHNEIDLTHKEYLLLLALLKNYNTYLSKDFLGKNIWHTNISSRTVDTHICTLRKKLGIYSKYIVCKKRFGYVYKKESMK